MYTVAEYRATFDIPHDNICNLDSISLMIPDAVCHDAPERTDTHYPSRETAIAAWNAAQARYAYDETSHTVTAVWQEIECGDDDPDGDDFDYWDRNPLPGEFCGGGYRYTYNDDVGRWERSHMATGAREALSRDGYIWLTEEDADI